MKRRIVGLLSILALLLGGFLISAPPANASSTFVNGGYCFINVWEFNADTQFIFQPSDNGWSGGYSDTYQQLASTVLGQWVSVGKTWDVLSTGYLQGSFHWNWPADNAHYYQPYVKWQFHNAYGNCYIWLYSDGHWARQDG